MLTLKKSGDTAGSYRYLNIRLKGEPPSIVIGEGGDSYFASSFTDSSADQTTSVLESDLPINHMTEREPVDLLITCSQSDFEIYFNGQMVKRISYWHNPTDRTFPSIQKISWEEKFNSKITKVSWTFSKWNK